MSELPDEITASVTFEPRELQTESAIARLEADLARLQTENSRLSTQRDDAFTELTEIRMFWQAAKNSAEQAEAQLQAIQTSIPALIEQWRKSADHIRREYSAALLKGQAVGIDYCADELAALPPPGDDPVKGFTKPRILRPVGRGNGSYEIELFETPQGLNVSRRFGSYFTLIRWTSVKASLRRAKQKGYVR